MGQRVADVIERALESEMPTHPDQVKIGRAFTFLYEGKSYDAAFELIISPRKS